MYTYEEGWSALTTDPRMKRTGGQATSGKACPLEFRISCKHSSCFSRTSSLWISHMLTRGVSKDFVSSWGYGGLGGGFRVEVLLKVLIDHNHNHT